MEVLVNRTLPLRFLLLLSPHFIFYSLLFGPAPTSAQQTNQLQNKIREQKLSNLHIKRKVNVVCKMSSTPRQHSADDEEEGERNVWAYFKVFQKSSGNIFPFSKIRQAPISRSVFT